MKTMIKKCIVAFGLFLFSFNSVANAQLENQSWSVRPSFGAGFNSAQGSYYSLGIVLQKWWSESILFGAAAYYSVGSPSVSTQGFEAGPFVAYYYPVADFLTLEARQAVEYVSQRTPLAIDDTQYTTESGVISVTSLGLHLRMMESFGLFAGYRYVLGIDKSELDDGRSGLYLGLGISL